MLAVSGRFCLKAKPEFRTNAPKTEPSEKSLATPNSCDPLKSRKISKLMPLLQSVSISPVRVNNHKLIRIRNQPELKLPGIQTQDPVIPDFEKRLMRAIVDQMQKKRFIGAQSVLKGRLKKSKHSEDLRELKKDEKSPKSTRIKSRRSNSRISFYDVQYFTPIGLKTPRF